MVEFCPTTLLIELKKRTMSFRSFSAPSDRHHGEDQDDDGYNHQKTPPSRDDVDMSGHFRANSPISHVSEDDGANPPPVPKRDNVSDSLCRMVSFGLLKLSEPSSTVSVLNGTDEESSVRLEKSACSSEGSAHASNTAYSSSSRTVKASNATKTSEAQVVKEVNAGMSRNERKAIRLKDLFRIPTVAAITGEQELDLQHRANLHCEKVGFVPETEYRWEPTLGYPHAETIDVGTTQIPCKDAKLTNSLRFPTKSDVGDAQEPNVQHKTNEHGDLPCTVPKTEYRFEPDLEFLSQSLPYATRDTIPAMDVEWPGETPCESVLRIVNGLESFSDEAVDQEREFFLTQVYKKWCVFAVFVMILLGAGIPMALTFGGGGSGSSSPDTPTAIPISSSSPTSSPTETPSAPPSRIECFEVGDLKQSLLPLSNDALNNKESPQSKALAWMVEQATQGLMLDFCHSREIIERYSLVVLYFATQGQTWVNLNFSSSIHHCSWNNGAKAPDGGRIGITCDDLFQTTRLDLMGNGLNGTIPSEIKFLTELKVLNFSDNNISGNLPSSLGQLSMLRDVDCGYNMLSGTFPSELFQISALEVVTFGFNGLNGTLPDIGNNVKRIHSIDFANNSLTGTLPKGLNRLNLLSRLHLGNNFLSGTIPRSIGSNKALARLNLANNSLEGSLPSTLGRLNKMEVFSSSNNMLKGTLPTELGLLTMMNTLELKSNKISGTIPSELGLLRELTILNLADNDFTGEFPTLLASADRLRVVHLEKNDLSGDLPPFCCGQEHYTSLKADCRAEIGCECSNFCCDSTGACK